MQGLHAILTGMIQDFGTGILENARRFKPAFMDCAQGKFRGEMEILVKIIEMGSFNAIKNAEELPITKNILIKRLQDEYFVNEKASADLVDLFASFVRKDAVKTGGGKKKDTPDKPAADAPKAKSNAAEPVSPGTAGKKMKYVYALIALCVCAAVCILIGVSGGVRGSLADLDMVFISAGTFTMGSPKTEPGREPYGVDETQHSVTLSKGFYMGKYEVTQEQYAAVMGKNPSEFTGAKRPVEQVSWFDALVFCNKLSILENRTPVYSIGGSTDPTDWRQTPDSTEHAYFSARDTVSANWNANGYRLPTEAEWKYACRAGTETAYSCARAELVFHAWYEQAATQEVGQKRPNPWGLYDMHGSVFEWCWDRFGEYTGAVTDPTGPSSGTSRVLHGGSWYYVTSCVRSAFRHNFTPRARGSSSYYNIGFRLVRSAS